jgi:hypothetical protein
LIGGQQFVGLAGEAVGYYHRLQKSHTQPGEEGQNGQHGHQFDQGHAVMVLHGTTLYGPAAPMT